MPLPDSFCPYVGLQPYTEEEHEFFFGRERDQRVIASNLFASAVTILYGASGVGKSSVLMAGVVPLLRKKVRTAVVVFRDWQRLDFLTTLKNECVQSVALATKKTAGLSVDSPLDELLFSIGEEYGITVLVLLDQFEEYFLYHPESETDNLFDGEFARAVNRDDVDANFLLALREEGLSKLDRFRARIPNLMGNLLRLRHLDEEAANDAICKPLNTYNERLERHAASVSIEYDLVASIVNQARPVLAFLSSSAGAGQSQVVEDHDGIESSFMQLVLTRLWEEELGADSRALRLSTLERLGGAGEIVRTHLDGVMARLKLREQTLCAGFFDRLVTPSGAKIACRLDDLREWAGDLADQVLPVAQVLSDSRILRTVSASPGQQEMSTSYEIFHDVLAPAILNWRRRFIEQQTVEKIRREEEKKREQERIRTVGYVTVIVFLLLMAFGYHYRMETKKIELERKTAASQEEAIKLRELAVASQEEAIKKGKQAEQRLATIKDNMTLIKATLSNKPFNDLKALAATTPDLINKDIQFKVTKTKFGMDKSKNLITYEYKLFPDVKSLPDGVKAFASITYRMVHPSFKLMLLPTGPETNFTVSYIGWAAINVIAIIEYADPEKALTFVIIDMKNLVEPE